MSNQKKVTIKGAFVEGKLQICKLNKNANVDADKGFVAVNAPFKPNASK